MESRLGEGTKFLIFVPRAAGPAVDRRAPKSGRASVLGLSGTRILLVEDDDAIALGMAALLEAEGAHVVHVADGLRALEVATTFQPDIAVLDMTLPDISGIEAYERLREWNRELPVIFNSGYAEMKTRVDAVSLENVAFLLKPYDFETFHAAVTSLLERTRGRRDAERLESLTTKR